MKRLSQEQFYKIMEIINKDLEPFKDYLNYKHRADTSIRIELSSFENRFERDLAQFTVQDDE